VRNLGPNQEHF